MNDDGNNTLFTSSPFKITCSIGIQCSRHSHYIFRSNKLLSSTIVFSRLIRSYQLNIKSLVTQWQMLLRIQQREFFLFKIEISYTRQVPRLVSGWPRSWSRHDIAINVRFKVIFGKLSMTACLFWQWLYQAREDTAWGMANTSKIIRQFTASLTQ